MIVSLCAPIMGAGVAAAYGQEENIDQCLDPAICPVPYTHLATQETDPFLFIGKVMNEDHPRYHQFKRALRKFPDVRSCLIPEEQEKQRPDLRQIDWSAIGEFKEINVCVFRIATSIDDVEGIRKWFRYHGFRLSNLSWSVHPRYMPKNETDRVSGFEAFLTVEQVRKIIPRSWIARLIGFEGMHGYSLAIGFSRSGRVVSVDTGGSTILN